VRLSRELARRTQLIRLVALTDRPWERPSDEFTHPDLRRWVAENRGTLIGAALTLCSAWVADGRPQGSVRTGSFEQWSGTMSGIMESIGVPGFMANAGELTEHGNDDKAKRSAFVLTWWETFGTKPVLAKDLVAMVADNDLLEGVLDANEDESKRKIKLGKKLRRQRDRYYGDLKIAAAGKAANGSQQLRLEVRPGVENPSLPVV
jgi:putative DNA primase/helicase